MVWKIIVDWNYRSIYGTESIYRVFIGKHGSELDGLVKEDVQLILDDLKLIVLILEDLWPILDIRQIGYVELVVSQFYLERLDTTVLRLLPISYYVKVGLRCIVSAFWPCTVFHGTL